MSSHQAEEENYLHPAKLMEQNHHDGVGGQDEAAFMKEVPPTISVVNTVSLQDEAAEEEGSGQEPQRGLKRHLVDVKMEPGTRSDCSLG